MLYEISRKGGKGPFLVPGEKVFYGLFRSYLFYHNILVRGDVFCMECGGACAAGIIQVNNIQG